MHFYLLSLLLASSTTLALPSPPSVESRSLHKRSYFNDKFVAQLGAFRSYYHFAPVCRGCPELSPEEATCKEERYGSVFNIEFPPDPRNKTESKTKTVRLCSWWTPVDIRCHAMFNQDDSTGISQEEAEQNIKKYGVPGCPRTAEETLKVVMIESGWSEEKSRRMLEIVGPGMFNGTDSETSPTITERAIRERQTNGAVDVDASASENPWNLPPDVVPRPLPPYGAILQKENLDCFKWTVGRRRENCKRISKRLGITVKRFLELNPSFAKEHCGVILAGYAYCAKSKDDVVQDIKKKLGWIERDGTPVV